MTPKAIRKVNILMCDTYPGLLPESIPSHESMFFNLFRPINPELSFDIYRVMEGELPEQFEPETLYLIPGSNNAAYDDLPWIQALQEWIRKAASQKVPLVGICFGHQLIAQALGGRVERFAGGWGVGIRESQILDEQLRSYFPDGRLRLIVNHHDQVMQLPEGATPLATSPFCRYEGFRIGHHILTFQGHPEFPVEYERHLILNHSENEDDTVKQQALKTLEEMEPQGKVVARFLLGVGC